MRFSATQPEKLDGRLEILDRRTFPDICFGGGSGLLANPPIPSHFAPLEEVLRLTTGRGACCHVDL